MVQTQERTKPAKPADAKSFEGVAATELRPWGSFTVLEEGSWLQNQAH